MIFRYYLLGKNIPRTATDPRAAVASLLDELKVNPEQYRYGVSKVKRIIGN
jgi:myosin heavy subunit